MNALLALTLVAVQCQEVFDQTEDCTSPSSLEVRVKDPPVVDTDDAPGSRAVGARFFAAAGVGFVLSSAVLSWAAWTGDHLVGVSNAGNLDGKTLQSLRDQQRVAIAGATTGYLITGILFGAGLSLFVFNPEDGSVYPGFEVLE